MTPTNLTIELLESEGYHVAIVERTIPHTWIKIDAFNMFDLIAIHDQQQGVLGVQATTKSNHSARVKKLLANPLLIIWKQAGNIAEVVSWQGDKVKRQII